MGVDLSLERLGRTLKAFGSQRGAARAFDQHLNWGDDDDHTGCSGNGIDINCSRPADFALARSWVDRHLPEPSTTRDWYLNALDLMEKDDAVCIHISR
jgi:hypothetical protein